MEIENKNSGDSELDHVNKKIGAFPKNCEWFLKYMIEAILGLHL